MAVTGVSVFDGSIGDYRLSGDHLSSFNRKWDASRKKPPKKRRQSIQPQGFGDQTIKNHAAHRQTYQFHSYFAALEGLSAGPKYEIGAVRISTLVTIKLRSLQGSELKHQPSLAASLALVQHQIKHRATSIQF